MANRGIFAASAAFMVVAMAYATTIGRADNLIQTTSNRTAQLWEYKAIRLALGDPDAQQRVLNELGADGWELATTQINPVPGTDGGAVAYVAILKRAKL